MKQISKLRKEKKNEIKQVKANIVQELIGVEFDS